MPAQEISPQYRPLITKRTADWCPNCGSWGWTFFHWVLEDNDDRAVIWAAHHSGSLETPVSGAIADNFGGFSQPIFYLNEVDLQVYSSNMSQKRTEVAQQVDAMAQQQPAAGIGLQAWIDGDVLHAEAAVEMLQDVQGAWRLGLYLVEKSHMAPQAGQSGEVAHQRLLRTALTDDTFGDVLTENGAQTGATYQVTASMTLTDPNWTADNLIVVAVLWQAEGDHFLPKNAAQTDDFALPTAVAETHAAALALWPNPATDVIRVRTASTVPAGEVRVYNALGEAVEAPVRQEDGALEVDV
ncbi:MAG: hypothetical protein D6818_03320, partial [Bacteroidetes bacterium]